jgi:hypothetical protein
MFVPRTITKKKNSFYWNPVRLRRMEPWNPRTPEQKQIETMKTEFTLFILSTLLMLSCQPQNTGNGQMSEEEEKAEEQLLVDNDAPTLAGHARPGR